MKTSFFTLSVALVMLVTVTAPLQAGQGALYETLPSPPPPALTMGKRPEGPKMPSFTGTPTSTMDSGTKEVKEGDSLFYRISATEPTRLSIEGGRISALNFIQEDLEVTQDNALGQAYLKPRVTDKAITLYVTTDSNITATLTLQPTPGPATSIRLRDAKRAQQAQQQISQKQAVVSVAADYTKAIESLMTVAAKDIDVSGVDVAQLNEPVRLWDGVSFVLRRRHEAHNMSVETYVLTNQGNTPLRMVEQAFFTTSVAAVAIDHHEVMPGESTVVYVARWIRE